MARRHWNCFPAMKTIACAVALLTAIPAFAAPPEGHTTERHTPVCVIGRTSKLNSIIIPRIDLRNVTVAEAFEIVRQKAKQLDPEGVGVNIVLKLPAEPSPAPTQKAAPAPAR
jgi:hypothetical protein